MDSKQVRLTGKVESILAKQSSKGHYYLALKIQPERGGQVRVLVFSAEARLVEANMSVGDTWDMDVVAMPPLDLLAEHQEPDYKLASIPLAVRDSWRKQAREEHPHAKIVSALKHGYKVYGYLRVPVFELQDKRAGEALAISWVPLKDAEPVANVRFARTNLVSQWRLKSACHTGADGITRIDRAAFERIRLDLKVSLVKLGAPLRAWELVDSDTYTRLRPKFRGPIYPSALVCEAERKRLLTEGEEQYVGPQISDRALDARIEYSEKIIKEFEAVKARAKVSEEPSAELKEERQRLISLAFAGAEEAVKDIPSKPKNAEFSW